MNSFLCVLVRVSCDAPPPSVSVTPGHYGQLLNVWERPRGVYPVSMAMLDLLLGMSRQDSSLSTNEMLACVVYVMKEMLSSSHSWRYRQPTSRDEIGGWSQWVGPRYTYYATVHFRLQAASSLPQHSGAGATSLRLSKVGSHCGV